MMYIYKMSVRSELKFYFCADISEMICGYADIILMRSGRSERGEVTKGNRVLPSLNYSEVPEMMELINPDFKELSEGVKVRSWVITSFDAMPPVWDEEKMKYLIYQQERGHMTGRLHWQGFVQFENEVTHSRAMKLCMREKKIWMRPAKDNKRAREYCMKRDTAVTPFVELGEWIGQGNRTHMMNEHIEKGMSKWELCQLFNGNQGIVAKNLKSVFDEDKTKQMRAKFLMDGKKVEVIKCVGGWDGFDGDRLFDTFTYGKDCTGYDGQKYVVCDRKDVEDRVVAQWVRHPFPRLSIKYENIYFCSEIVVIENCGEGADLKEKKKMGDLMDKFMGV